MNRITFPAVLTLIATSIAFADVQPASKPADKDQGTLRYEIVAVEGKVRVGPETDEAANSNGPGWFTPKAGDMLGAGLQIRVPLRARIKLVAHPAEPPTVVLIESMSNIAITELAFKNGAATSRIKLAYGAIRAGVMEGGTRSDMEIEAPTATLSKKGTDIFRFEYHDGRFQMSLTEQGRGMLQAIQNQTGGYQGGQLSRFVTAGQFVTQQLVRAIDNVQFDRNINVNDQFGLIGNDKLFTMLNDRGLGFLLPSGNKPVNLIDGNRDGNPNDGNNLLDPNANNNNAINTVVRTTPVVPGGNFGIGQGRLPTLQGTRQQLGQINTTNRFGSKPLGNLLGAGAHR